MKAQKETLQTLDQNTQRVRNGRLSTARAQQNNVPIFDEDNFLQQRTNCCRTRKERKRGNDLLHSLFASRQTGELVGV